MRKGAVAAAAVLVVIVLAGVAVYTQPPRTPSTSTTATGPAARCDPIPGGTHASVHLNSTTFGAVTEWALPGSGRIPDAVLASPDGSVWFAEQEVPGVAHLYPGNGTLVEYAWPGFPTPEPPDCLDQAESSGIAFWNGMVWAADMYANNGVGAVIGVNPATGSTERVNLTGQAAFPYWLAVGPHDDLWYTSDNITQYPARLGRISPDLTVSAVDLIGVSKYDEPIQVDIVNSSLGLIAALDQVGTPKGGCVCTGHIYSFDPSVNSTSVPVSVVGGNYTLVLPDSVSYSDGRVWVAQHGASSVVSYDFATGSWTKYPTSLVPWTYTTLPYVIYASGSDAWFNEHYADKIALLHSGSGTLTEYSESDPPASNGSGIQNDISIAPAAGGLWFTSLSGNYVGFVNGSYAPSFAISPPAGGPLSLSPGGTASVSLDVNGSWSAPLVVNSSDTEDYASVPDNITITPSVLAIPPGTSQYVLRVQIAAAASLPAGDYTVAVTVTEGEVQQTAFVFLVVS